MRSPHLGPRVMVKILETVLLLEIATQMTGVPL
jgi:hypothetical protein